MKIARKHSWSALGVAALSVLSAGCMEFPEGEAPVVMATHVKDWRDEIIYQVLVDRFADGDWGNNFSIFPSAPGKWHGGDWRGLESKLDYLDELGVTTLWISPVVKNVYTDAGFDAYHGYWAQDLTQPAPQFGDLAALRSLVRAAHDRNMKVILDIVTNHMGQLFYYDINGNGQADDPLSISKPPSPEVYKENEYDPTYDVRGVQAATSLGESGLAPIIFAHDPGSNHMPPFPEIFQDPGAYNRKGRTYNFDDPDQLERGDFPGGLKDVNTAQPLVRLAMVDAYTRWIELTDIDGFRIDTVKHVERGFGGFLRKWCEPDLTDKERRISSCSARPLTAETISSAPTRRPMVNTPSTRRCSTRKRRQRAWRIRVSRSTAISSIACFTSRSNSRYFATYSVIAGRPPTSESSGINKRRTTATKSESTAT
jgi:Alpha amylase, catalytic domain